MISLKNLRFQDTRMYMYSGTWFMLGWFTVAFSLTSDPLGSFRDLDVEEFFDCEGVRLFVAHHRTVVETIEVGQRLEAMTKKCPMRMREQTRK